MPIDMNKIKENTLAALNNRAEPGSNPDNPPVAEPQPTTPGSVEPAPVAPVAPAEPIPTQTVAPEPPAAPAEPGQSDPGDSYTIEEILSLVGGEPAQEPGGDGFIEGLDPAKIPEELQPFYKSMQKGFTQTQQQLQQEREQIRQQEESLRSELESLKNMTTDPVEGDDYLTDSEKKINAIEQRQQQADEVNRFNETKMQIGNRFNQLAEDPVIGKYVKQGSDKVVEELGSQKVATLLNMAGPEFAGDIIEGIVARHFMKSFNPIFKDRMTNELNVLRQKAAEKKPSLGVHGTAQPTTVPTGEKVKYGSFRKAVEAKIKEKYGINLEE